MAKYRFTKKMAYAARLERELRTPTSEAHVCLGLMYRATQNPAVTLQIINQIIDDVDDPGITGDWMAEELSSSPKYDEGYDYDAVRDARVGDSVLVAITYAAEAMKAEIDGRLNLAWALVMEAHSVFITGFCDALVPARGSRAMAALGARASHREDHEMKQQAISYYEENSESFASKNKAAEYIARHIVNVSVRTAAGWLNHLRPAGKR